MKGGGGGGGEGGYRGVILNVGVQSLHRQQGLIKNPLLGQVAASIHGV